jgi:hypothetical protein
LRAETRGEREREREREREYMLLIAESYFLKHHAMLNKDCHSSWLAEYAHAPSSNGKRGKEGQATFALGQ